MSYSVDNGSDTRHSPVPSQSFECRFVHHIPLEDKCEWVKNTPDCHEFGNSIFDYANVYYCTFNVTQTLSYVGIFLFVLILIILFIILGTTADDFFCPALAVVSRVLRMSDTVAGVTILAFGNGAPDFFTSMAAPDDNVKMVYAQLLGAGMFVTTVIAGMIMVVCPFRLSPTAFVKDCAFYILSVIYVFWIFSDEVMTIYEVAGLLAIYMAYILAVVVVSYIVRVNAKIAEREGFVGVTTEDENVLRSQRKSILLRDRPSGYVDDGEEPQMLRAHRKSLLLRDRSQSMTPHSVGLPPPPLNPVVPLPPVSLGRGHSVSNFTKLHVALSQERNKVLREVGFNIIADEEASGHKGQRSIEGKIVRPAKLLKEFAYDLIPFDQDEWEVSNHLMRFAIVIKMPIVFVLTLMIPVVNYTALNNGWSRLLNTMHCITLPLMFVFSTQLAMYPVYAWIKLWMIMLAVGTIFAIIVFSTSGLNPPKYHNAFAFLGFIGSVAVIYRVANEVVSVLSAIGVAVQISDTTLGVTALSWGNSMGDFIADVAIAKAGYPRMGFAACFGSPLFNMLFGMGMKFMITLLEEGETQRDMNYGELGPVCTAYLLYSLCSSIIVLPLLGFQARCSYGVYLIILYLLFVVYCVMCEVSFIHPYGTHHTI